MVVDFQGIYIYTYESMSMTATSLYAYDCVRRMLKVYFWKLPSTKQKSGIRVCFKWRPVHYPNIEIVD